jgi:hypothetical protein
MSTGRYCLLGLFVAGCWEVSAHAQMVTVGTGYQANGVRFGESFNVGWTFRNEHLWAQFNGGGGPPFGAAAGNPGFATGMQAGPLGLTFSAGQSASRFSSSVTPVLTSTSGHPSSLFVGTVQPFVIGTWPVAPVGVGFPQVPPPVPWTATTPLAERMLRGELSLERPRGPRGDERPPERVGQPAARPRERSAPPRGSEATVDELLAKGEAAEREGKQNLAKVYYRLAAVRTHDPRHVEASARLERLSKGLGAEVSPAPRGK